MKARYTLVVIKLLAQVIHTVHVSREGALFCSRDEFLPTAAAIAQGDQSYDVSG